MFDVDASGRVPVKMWTRGVQVEEQARQQLRNREVMMGQTVAAISTALQRPIDATAMAVNCHHNYVSREHHFGENVLVTRKDAFNPFGNPAIFSSGGR